MVGFVGVQTGGKLGQYLKPTGHMIRERARGVGIEGLQG